LVAFADDGSAASSRCASLLLPDITGSRRPACSGPWTARPSSITGQLLRIGETTRSPSLAASVLSTSSRSEEGAAGVAFLRSLAAAASTASASSRATCTPASSTRSRATLPRRDPDGMRGAPVAAIRSRLHRLSRREALPRARQE
jgi:hypothetical protein